jgi:hypothetical protein
MLQTIRLTSNNPREFDTLIGARAPMSFRCMRRTGETEEVLERTPSNPSGSTVTKVSHHNDHNLAMNRVIYHPGFDTAIEYPNYPDRTFNYYYSAVRKLDVTQTKTLTGSVNFIDRERFDDVVIKEVWVGGQRRMTMLSEFFQTLRMFSITPPPLGRYLSWCPFDLSFERHLIQPIELKAGEVDVDVREIRPNLDTSLDSYIDRQVTFTFKLIKPAKLADGNIVLEPR